jgi:hypothetical protein
MMKESTRRRTLLAFLALLLSGGLLAAGLSGCGGPAGGSFDPSAESPAVYALMDGFEKGIEAYDVARMTGPLTGSFKLTLTEGGLSHDKTLVELTTELQADASNQAYWRSHYGYHLDLQFPGMVVTVMSETSGTAYTLFSVTEWADGLTPPIPATVTDRGTLSAQLAKVGGSWKIAALTISFNPLTRAALASGSATSNLPGNGFFRRPR